ncbi:uncharacterized protein METZ01_LOCUS517755, partial [marine metagenome]
KGQIIFLKQIRIDCKTIGDMID